MMVFKTIWNCREKCENNVSKSKACTAMVFETIWNCREHFENNVSKECILTVFEMIWNCRFILENNVSKACILDRILNNWDLQNSFDFEKKQYTGTYMYINILQCFSEYSDKVV